MILILLVFSGAVGRVVMSTLAAVLIVAAVGSFRTGAVRAIEHTGRISQVAVVATFVATLLLPVAAAVGLGLVPSLLMQLNQEAVGLRVVQLEPHPEGGFVERAAPERLASYDVVLLHVYGLFYAGAAPRPGGPATAFAVLSDYAQR